VCSSPCLRPLSPYVCPRRMATATPDLRLTSNQIKSNLSGTQDHKTQTASYKIKNIKKTLKREKNGATRTQRQKPTLTWAQKKNFDYIIQSNSTISTTIILQIWRLLILDLKLLTDGNLTMLSDKAFQILSHGWRKNYCHEQNTYGS